MPTLVVVSCLNRHRAWIQADKDRAQAGLKVLAQSLRDLAVERNPFGCQLSLHRP